MIQEKQLNPMKNKILIGIAISMIVFVLFVRYLYSQKFEEFRKSISNQETEQLNNFMKEKENEMAILYKGDRRISQLFSDQFNENIAITERDTTFSLLYLNGNLKYKIPSLNYIECLHFKCIIDKQNEINRS